MADDIKVDEKSEAVEVASSSAEKLLNGLAKTEDAARISSESFEKKKENFPDEFVCNSCGFVAKSISGMKKHWSSSKGKCDKEKGYKTVNSAKIEESDREAFKESEVQKKIRMAAKATEELRAAQIVNSSGGRNITAIDLVRCPTSMLEDMLKKASTSEVKKFSSMRFHPANASRKYLADKELENRA